MNRELLEISNLTDKFKFPSPTGVKYYEFSNSSLSTNSEISFEFPSPTGVKYYEYVLGSS